MTDLRCVLCDQPGTHFAIYRKLFGWTRIQARCSRHMPSRTSFDEWGGQLLSREEMICMEVLES